MTVQSKWLFQRATRVLSVCVLAALIAGCGSDDDNDDHSHDDAGHNGMHHDAQGDATHELDESREKATENGEFFVTYTPTPDPIPFNEPFSLAVNVYESADQEVAVVDADVSVDVMMPTHGHGMTTEPVVSGDPGPHYLVEGMKFHMQSNSPAERWEIEVSVEKDGTSDTAIFEVMCCEE